MGIYIDSIKKPFQNLNKTVIGCLFNIIPVVNFIALGYIVDMVDIRLKQQHHFPRWPTRFSGYFKLFLKGLIMLFVGVGYVGPAALIYLVVFLYVPSLIVQLIAIILFLLWMLIAIYVIPYAVIRLVKTEDFPSAFDIKHVFRGTFNLTYFRDFIVAFSITLLFSAISIIVIMAAVYFNELNIPTYQKLGLLIFNVFIPPALTFIGLQIFILILTEAYLRVNKN